MSHLHYTLTESVSGLKTGSCDASAIARTMPEPRSGKNNVESGMATPQEIRAKLESLTPEEFRRFRDCFGGDGNDANYYVSQLFACPQYEAKMCYCLGLPTEADRINRAICDS